MVCEIERSSSVIMGRVKVRSDTTGDNWIDGVA